MEWVSDLGHLPIRSFPYVFDFLEEINTTRSPELTSCIFLNNCKYESNMYDIIDECENTL